MHSEFSMYERNGWLKATFGHNDTPCTYIDYIETEQIVLHTNHIDRSIKYAFGPEQWNFH